MRLGIFVVSALSFSHVIGFSNGFQTPTSWELINFLNGDFFPYTSVASY